MTRLNDFKIRTFYKNGHCLKLTMKTLRQYQWHGFGVFNGSFEQCFLFSLFLLTIFFWSYIFIFCSWRLSLLSFDYFLMWIYFVAVLYVISIIKWNLNLYWKSIWKDSKYLDFLKHLVLFIYIIYNIYIHIYIYICMYVCMYVCMK